MPEKLIRLLAIKEVRPTIFFVEEEGNLKQGIDILIENKENPTKVSVEINFSKQKESISIENVEKGQKTYRIYIPEIQKKSNVEFVLSSQGKAHHRTIVELAPQKHWQIYVVHSSHHDLGYTDIPSNVFLEHDSYLDEILDFCEKTKDWPEESKFKYSIEQFWSLNHFIKNRSKETVDKLIKFIKKGQIEVTALFGNEVTELCGHEELIRLLYPSFELKRKYDISITCAELNDIPGLSWGLPKILAGAGVKYFSPYLPDYFSWHNVKVHTFWDESKVLPRDMFGAFWWEGQDGARVLFWFAPFFMRSFKEEDVSSLLERLDRKGYQFDSIRVGFWGGDRDNSPPSLQLSYLAREWNNKYVYPKLIVGTNEMFFKHLDKESKKVKLPLFRGELPNTDYTIGATSSARETGLNKATHDQLLSAEKFAAVTSYLSDYIYPSQRIKNAYENMFLYDLHCWGISSSAGPVQDASRSEKTNFAYKASVLTQDVLVKSVNKIADNVELKDDDWYILVFNPLSWKRNDIIFLPLKNFPPCGRPNYKKNENDLLFSSGTAIGRNVLNLPLEFTKKPFRIIDIEKKKEVPYQIIKLQDPLSPVPYASERFSQGQIDPSWLYEILFIGEDVPSIGYKTYKIEEAEKPVNFKTNISVTEKVIENRFFKVCLDHETGAIKSIYDKEFDRELVDTMAPHKFNQFLSRWAKDGKENYLKKIEIQKGEVGPICGSLIVKGSSVGCPEVIQKIILYENIKRIDFANRILKDSLPFLEIYFSFPFKVENPSFHFEGSNSVIEPLKDQFPGSNSDYYAVQHWANIANDKIGITFSSMDAPNMEFGGLWPGYVSQAHHGITPPNFGHKFLKKGELKKGWVYSYVMANNFRTNFYLTQVSDSLFRYSITTHNRDWRGAQVHKFGWSFQNSLIPVCMKGKKEGKLSVSQGFCEVDKPNVLLLTLKQAEDGEGLIVRLIEIEGKYTKTKVTLPFFTIARAYRTNLVEENEKILSAQKHTVEVSVKAFGITTIRVQ